MKLYDVNLITSMKNVYVPPGIVKQILGIIENLDRFLSENDLQLLQDKLHQHIALRDEDYGDDVSSSISRDLLLNKLYQEWMERTGLVLSYSEFLIKLIGELYYYTTITPDTITFEDKIKFIVTVCSAIEYLRKHHYWNDINIIHNGLFVNQVNEIINIINRDSIFENTTFLIDHRNQRWLTLRKVSDELIRDVYDVPELINDPAGKENYPYLSIQLYEMMDYVINKYQDLLDWQYTWDHRRTIGLLKIFSRENIPYYTGIRIDKKISFYPNTSLFLDFTFNHCIGLTHLFALRRNDGSLYFSLLYDSDSETIKLLVNKLNSNSSLSILDLITYDQSPLNQYKNYKIDINFNRTDNVINVKYSIDNNQYNIVSLSCPIVQYLPYYPEYMECAFKFDSNDKVNINAYHHILTYDNTLYPNLYETLRSINV